MRSTRRSFFGKLAAAAAAPFLARFVREEPRLQPRTFRGVIPIPRGSLVNQVLKEQYAARIRDAHRAEELLSSPRTWQPGGTVRVHHSSFALGLEREMQQLREQV